MLLKIMLLCSLVKPKTNPKQTVTETSHRTLSRLSRALFLHEDQKILIEGCLCRILKFNLEPKLCQTKELKDMKGEGDQ